MVPRADLDRDAPARPDDGFDRKQVASTLERVLAARQLLFAAPERLVRALGAYAVGRGDLADYVIREHAKASACDSIVTFDKVLHADEMFAAP